MKILFLNCANRKIQKQLNAYIHNNNFDIIILSESFHIKQLDIFTFHFIPEFQYGIRIFSKYDFSINEINYLIDDSRIPVKVDNHRYRILEINLRKITILAVHIDYGWYNPFAMKKLEEHIKQNKCDLIIGDFNSGYIEDSLDSHTGGLVFQNGYLFISKSKIKRRFRIDHCFVRNIKANVKHIYEFLNENTSDHAGIEVDIEE